MSKGGSESDLENTLVDDSRRSDDGSNHSQTEGSRTIPQSGSNEGSSAEQNETLPVTSEANSTSSTSGLNTSVGKGRGAMSETMNSRDPFDSRPGGSSESYPSTSGGAGQGRLRSSYRGTEYMLGGPNDSSYNMPGQNYPYGGLSGGPYGMSGQNYP